MALLGKVPAIVAYKVIEMKQTPPPLPQQSSKDRGVQIIPLGIMMVYESY